MNEDGIVTKKAFMRIAGWFDKCEASPVVASLAASPTKLTASPSQPPSPGMSQSLSSPSQFLANVAQEAMASDEDEEEVLDEDRLDAVKALLFDAYRIQNRQGLMLADFERDLEFIFRERRAGTNDERTLYHTMLCMPE